MKKIVLDLYGGDNGVEALLPGAVGALNEVSELEIVLAGDEAELTGLLSAYEYDGARLSVIHAPKVLTNRDNPTLAVHGDNGYTISAAFDYYASCGDADNLISVGSTGAVFVSSLVKLGLLDGVVKPVLGTLLPYSDKGRLCLLDCGANLEPTAEDMLLFARLGCDYMKSAFGIERPATALLSVGKEEGKGTEKLKSVFAALKEGEFNFKGNIEPEDIFTGKYDVVVCDGFTGNMILKNTESTGRILVERLCAAAGEDARLIGGLADKIGLFYRFNDYGGAMILGVKKPVIKAHGSATADTIKSCIYQAIM
ncbi:MAG: hypothetical protein NC223_02595 [Butyrivibrio sp.]|nr:hypothetical protein [Butyrivibrio sp.]